MSGSDSYVVYEFGDFRLDAGRRLLFAKGVTEPLSITPKAFETIHYFVEHPGVLLEKDRLLADLWPGLVVEENNLTQVISGLRRVLGEARGENRYLVTEPGRGYRFVADVVRVAQARGDEDSRPARRIAYLALAGVISVGALAFAWNSRWWADDRLAAPDATTAGTLALPANSVAVLPFENLSTDPGDEFMATGIAESLLHRLAGIHELTLISRNSSFAFQGKSTDAREIGRALNARYLVEGSVQRANEQLRVTAQLIDATTGTHVWSLRFDRPLDDIFGVEDEIAQRVAQALTVSLDLPANPNARFGTEAYLAFLEGQALVSSRRSADAERAIERFTRAVELAPTFAEAHAALANAHRHLAYLHEDRPEGVAMMEAARRKALPSLARALELDAGLGEAYVMRADWHAFAGDLQAAEADYRKGLSLSPNFGVGHEHFAEFLEVRLARIDEALAELDIARRVDPLTPRHHYRKGLILLLRGETAESNSEAESLFLKSLQVAPDFHPALMRLSQIRWHQGRFAEAIQLGEQAVAIEPSAHWMRRFLAEYYLDLDDVDAARDVITARPPVEDQIAWMAICFYRGEFERAADLVRPDLERSSRSLTVAAIAPYAIRDAGRTKGDLKRAQRELLSLRPDDRSGPELDTHRLATLAQVHDALGQWREAQVFARQVLDILAANQSPRFSHPRAVALAVLGKPQAAVDALEQGFADGGRSRWWYTLNREPAFDALRDEPRFEALDARVRAHAAAERRQLESRRSSGEIPVRANRKSDANYC